MKYCTHCGNQLLDEAIVCPKCGCAVGGATISRVEDVPSSGLNVVSFLFPIVGLICYAAMHATTPKKAKAAGKAALISAIICTILYIIYFIILASLW